MKNYYFYVRAVMYYGNRIKAEERDYTGYRYSDPKEAEVDLRNAEANPYVVAAWIEMEV